MSTKDNLDKILKRVSSAMCGESDAVWLRNLFRTQEAIIDQLKQERDNYARKLGKRVGNVLVDPDWRFGDD